MDNLVIAITILAFILMLVSYMLIDSLYNIVRIERKIFDLESNFREMSETFSTLLRRDPNKKKDQQWP